MNLTEPEFLAVFHESVIIIFCFDGHSFQVVARGCELVLGDAVAGNFTGSAVIFTGEFACDAIEWAARPAFCGL